MNNLVQNNHNEHVFYEFALLDEEFDGEVGIENINALDLSIDKSEKISDINIMLGEVYV